MPPEVTHYEGSTAPRDLTCNQCGGEIPEGSEYLKGKTDDEVTIAAFHAVPCEPQYA